MGHYDDYYVEEYAKKHALEAVSRKQLLDKLKECIQLNRTAGLGRDLENIVSSLLIQAEAVVRL